MVYNYIESCNLRMHMYGVISVPPNPYRKGGPYEGQFGICRDGEEHFPDSDLVLLGGTHLHFDGPAKAGELSLPKCEEQPGH